MRMASVAIAVCGKIRLPDVEQIWIQNSVLQKQLAWHKVATAFIIAFFTKCSTGKRLPSA